MVAAISVRLCGICGLRMWYNQNAAVVPAKVLLEKIIASGSGTLKYARTMEIAKSIDVTIATTVTKFLFGYDGFSVATFPPFGCALCGCY